MPKLPDKFDLGGAPSVGRRPITQASASDFSTGGGLMVANEVVKGVGGLAKIAITKQEEADDYEVQKSIVDFDLEQEKRLDDAKRNAPPEAKDFTSSYRRGYDEAATGLMTRVPERLKPQVDAMLVKRRAAFEKRAYDFELAERDRWNIQDVGGRLEDSYGRVGSNPDSLRAEIDRTLPVINKSPLPVRTKIELRRKYLDQVHEYAIKEDIARAVERRDIDRLRELNGRLNQVRRGSSSQDPADGWTTTVGAVSEKYESAGKGVGFVSTGSGDPGGPSYGKHQLSSKDSMPAFLQSEEGSVYAERFKGLRPGTPAFNQAYKEIAREDPEGLGKAQHGFYTRTHYQPLLEHAKGKGLAVEDRGVQEALFSISVQHGGARKIVDAALSRAGEDPADQIKALYAARSRYVSRLGDLPPDTKASVLNRYKSEMQDALALVGQSGDEPQGDGVTRKDLGPVQVAEAKTGTMTDAGPDTGTALTKDGMDRGVPSEFAEAGSVNKGVPGDFKEAGSIDGKAGATKDADGFVESEKPPYDVTEKLRHKLKREVRNAMIGIVTKEVDDDIARLRLGRPIETDAKGRTSLDRAQGTMTQLQLETKTRAWKEAGLEREELTALRRMPLDEADNHVASIVDRAEKNDIPVSAAAKVQAKAQTTLEKMRVMSNTDPVRLITGSFGDEADDRMPPAENVAKVMRILKENRVVVASTGPDGMALRVGPEGRIPRVTDDDAPSEMPGRIGQAPIPPREQWKMLLDARIADQRALMPYDDHKYRLLNAKEAEQLLGMPKGKELSKTDYKKHLEGVWERTQQKFPPEYANKVFKEAINHHLKGDVDGAKADIIYKIAKGQPLTETDFDRVRQLEDINSTSLSASFENQAGLLREGASPFVDTMARIDRAGRSQGMPAIAPAGDPGLPAIAAAPSFARDWGGGVAVPAVSNAREPTAKQMDWLRQDPAARFRIFSQTFGADAAATALLGPGTDAWGSARANEKFPKSKDADAHMKAIPPSGKRSWLNPLGL